MKLDTLSISFLEYNQLSADERIFLGEAVLKTHVPGGNRQEAKVNWKAKLSKMTGEKFDGDIENWDIDLDVQRENKCLAEEKHKHDLCGHFYLASHPELSDEEWEHIEKRIKSFLRSVNTTIENHAFSIYQDRLERESA